jgi:hypothetical protein
MYLDRNLKIIHRAGLDIEIGTCRTKEDMSIVIKVEADFFKLMVK